MTNTLRMSLLSALAGLCVVPSALARPDRLEIGAALGGHEAGGHEACFESRLLGRMGPMPGRDPSGRIDPDTGRDLLNYPPDRFVDYGHMQVRLFIADMNEPTAQAVQTLRFTPIAQPLRTLTLDAVGLAIDRVEARRAPGQVEGARRQEFDHDGLKLTITFDPPLPAGEPAEIITTYTVNDPPGGLIWTPETPDWPGRPAQIHTQGEPQTSSLWFPCHDFPNEKLTTQVVVTVPEGFIASSNGRLVSRSAIEVAGRAYETFDWLQDAPHTNYLVTLVVGQFDVVDVASGGRGRVPMPVYVPPGRGADVEATYGKTAAMVDFFEDLLDEPYPWDQYAQAVVWNFGWGGMENTSATTMYDTAILSPEALIDHDLEGLISHELAHQWFGDLVTCNSWEHIWLNEGFATYLTALWFEHARGGDDYQSAVRGNFDGVIGAATGHAPETPAMVSKVWGAPWETFRRQNNPYPHGASVLHMLRRRLGDQVFFAGVAEYLDRTRHQTAETRDLRRAFEDVSGENLEQFFWQWCERPGVPRLDVDIQWASDRGELRLTVEQTQHIDGFNPAYALDLPLVLGHAAQGDQIQWTTIPLAIDERRETFVIPLTRDATIAAIDPDMHILAALSIDQPEERWVAQLEHGPTLAARVQAARALGALDPAPSQPAAKAPEAREDRVAGGRALARTAGDGHMHESLRRECIGAMASRGDIEGLLDQLQSADVPSVRVAAIEGLRRAASEASDADAASARADAAIRPYLAPDNATRVRAAAIRAVARLDRPDAYDAIVPFLRVESQDDGLRQSALEALADLDEARALPLILAHTHPRTNSRTRATAIGAAVRLSRHDPDLVFSTLAPLLRDRQRRTFLAAGQALVDLGDERGLGILQSLRDEVIDPDTVWSLESWMHALRESIEAAAP